MKRIKQFIDRNRSYVYHETSKTRWVPGPDGKPVIEFKSTISEGVNQ